MDWPPPAPSLWLKAGPTGSRPWRTNNVPTVWSFELGHGSPAGFGVCRVMLGTTDGSPTAGAIDCQPGDVANRRHRCPQLGKTSALTCSTLGLPLQA